MALRLAEALEEKRAIYNYHIAIVITCSEWRGKQAIAGKVYAMTVTGEQIAV